MDLSNLSDGNKRRKRKGRGPGSQRGKTSCRGHKGDKSRSGYKRRTGTEGGQIPLFRRLPIRGFSNARFAIPVFSISLERIDQLFEDGETVSRETLMEKGYQLRRISKVKILGNGDLTKKVVIKADALTKSAIKKLEEKSIEFTLTHK